MKENCSSAGFLQGKGCSLQLRDINLSANKAIQPCAKTHFRNCLINKIWKFSSLTSKNGLLPHWRTNLHCKFKDHVRLELFFQNGDVILIFSVGILPTGLWWLTLDQSKGVNEGCWINLHGTDHILFGLGATWKQKQKQKTLRNAGGNHTYNKCFYISL